MNEMHTTAFADPELVELCDGEPDLLVIADAVIASTRNEAGVRRSRLRPFGPPRKRPVLLAAVLLTVIAAAPALAFSTTVRELVGIKAAPPPFLTATITSAHTSKRYPRAGATVTIAFTVGAQGKTPGTEVPRGSVFFVHLGSNKAGVFIQPVPASGSNGHYQATVRWPGGRIAGVTIGGYLNRVGASPADGGFWIPITIANNPY